MDVFHLEMLIEEGRQQEIEALLDQVPDLSSQITSQGVTPLMLAAYYKKNDIAHLIASYVTNISIHEACAINDIPTVEKHIESVPADVNKFSADGFTPLGLACFFGFTELSKLLVENGADVNLPTNNGFNAYPLHSACIANNLSIVNMLLLAGADPNVKQTAGLTPLHTAAEYGNVELIISLLEHGALTNIRMEGGKLPSDLAADKGYTDIAEILTD